VREEETLAIIYLDNAATSWPKAPGVSAAMVRFLEEVGANPGRSGHRLSIEAGRIVDDAREALAQLFRAPDPLRVIFTANATEALNLALQGLLRPGDHVVTSSVEHNSVMRPLRALESTGVALTVVPCAPDGTLDPARLEAAIGPTTRLIGITHASNVVGTLLPVAEAGRIARRRDLLLLVDAAADAGAFPIDVVEEQIDLLAFTGHKSLYGPMGTGGLVIGDRVDPARLRPLKWGGTGSRSDREEQPAFLPDCYESGTLNAVGLAGLAASVRWLLERGVEAIRERQVELVQHLIDGLSSIEGVTVHGTCDARLQVAPVSFTLRGISPSDAALRLDEEHGVLCRVGLHCAPAAHRTIGTFPAGTIRFAAGTFNTEAEIDAAIAAVAALVPPAGGEVTS
jgi:cysteine desulfurase family protein